MIIDPQKYKEYMSQEYTPIEYESLQYDYDINALKAYAKEKGVPIRELSMEEKRRFLVPRKKKEKTF